MNLYPLSFVTPYIYLYQIISEYHSLMFETSYEITIEFYYNSDLKERQ